MNYGIALEGGGAKGAYHAGALQAIDELGLNIGGVTGTSIGSINAAYYLQEGSKALAEFWSTVEPSYIIPDSLVEFQKRLKSHKTDNHLELFKEISRTLSQGGMSVDSFRAKLDEMIDEDKLRQQDKDFGLVTVSIRELKAVQIMLEAIEPGKLNEFLLASSYLPGFKREKLSGKSYIDGAFYDNLPVNLLIDQGYKKIITVELLGLGLKKKPKDSQVEIIPIRPSDDTGHVLDFKADRAKTNIKMGYFDTMRVFKGYYGQWYYLKDLWTPDQAFQWLSNLGDKTVQRLGDLMGIKDLPSKRAIFELIMPVWMDLLKIPTKANYNMILLYIVEFTAQSLEIDRYQVVSMDELIDLVSGEIRSRQLEEPQWDGIVSRLLKASKLHPHINKRELALQCARVIFDQP